VFAFYFTMKKRNIIRPPYPDRIRENLTVLVNLKKERRSKEMIRRNTLTTLKRATQRALIEETKNEKAHAFNNDRDDTDG